VTTRGYALNVDLDPAPFTEWITACGIEAAQFTTMARELERPVAVDEVRPHALATLAEVFDLDFEEFPRDALAAFPLKQAHERQAQPPAVSKSQTVPKFATARTASQSGGSPYSSPSSEAEGLVTDCYLALELPPRSGPQLDSCPWRSRFP